MKKFSSLILTALLVSTLFVFIGCSISDEDEETEKTDNGLEKEDGDNTSGKDEKEDLCGNGEIDPGEECDSYLTKCTDIDPELYTGGNALCNNDCTFDLSSCTKKKETPDYDYEVPDDNNNGNDNNDPSDVTSGFSNNPDCQCTVDRNSVCTKADYDAWSGAPMPAPENKNVSRLCIGGIWVWAPFAMVSNESECNESVCLPGEARQFLQAGAASFCVCLNKCVKQGDQAENQSCGAGRKCIAINDVNKQQVHVCGGHQ